MFLKVEPMTLGRRTTTGTVSKSEEMLSAHRCQRPLNRGSKHYIDMGWKTIIDRYY